MLAGGFAGAWVTMQLPISKTTLDFVYYGYPIYLYVPLNLIVFLGMILFGIITGTQQLTNKKSNEGD